MILNAFAGTLKESFGSNELTKEDKMLRKRALDAQVNRDKAINKHFKLMNDKLEQESKNSAARISGGHLQSIEEVLRMAHLSEHCNSCCNIKVKWCQNTFCIVENYSTQPC